MLRWMSRPREKVAQFSCGDFRLFLREEVSAVIDLNHANIGSFRREGGLQPFIVNRGKAKHGISSFGYCFASSTSCGKA